MTGNWLKSGKKALCVLILASGPALASDLRLEQLYRAEQFDRLIEVGAPRLETMDRRNRLILARAYEQKGDHLNEIRVLRMVISRNEQDFVAHTMLGDALYRWKQDRETTTQAIASFRNALNLRRNHLPAYQGLLRSYERLQNNYELRIVYQDMMEHFGERAEFVSALCRLHSIDGYLDAAHRICSLAIERDPSNADNHVYLGLSLKDALEPNRALAVLRKAASDFPQSELAQRAYADLLKEKEDFEAAFRHYAQAIKADGSSFKSMLGLALTAFETGRYEISVSSFENACRMDRAAVHPLRRTSSLLRQRSAVRWYQRFDRLAENCGVQ